MRCSLVLIGLLVSALAYSQFNSFINLGIEEGLAQSQVNDICHDPSGYLWVATASGLSRFDGAEIKNFYKSDGLVDNVVTHILIGKEGEVYFGGAGGFSIYKNNEFTAHSFPNSIVDSRIQHMQLSNDSTIWMATNRDGYFSFSLRRNEFTVPITDLGTNIRWLDIHKGLVAGSKGLFNYGQLIHPKMGLNISDVQIDGDKIWVSTLGDGLWHFNEEWIRVSEGVDNSSYLRDIIICSNGDFWGVGPEGALLYSNGKWTSYGANNGLGYENLRAIEEDLEGNIWLASNGQGLFRFTGSLFNTYVQGNPLESDIMLSAVEAHDELFLGMFDNRIQKLDAQGQVRVLGDFMRTDVWCMLSDSHGRIWAGTSSGLFRTMDGNVFEEQYAEELPNKRITALYEDSHGNICIGHREGMTIAFSDDELFHYNEENGFDGKRIRAIDQTVDGAIWVGAQNGLYRLEDDWILKLDESNGLNDNTIYSIQDDSYGRMWVGAKNGLHILKDDSVLQIMLSGRVDANNINFLHCSSSGYIYVGTNQGLFTAQVLEEVSEMNFRQFGIADGLPGLECNLNAVYQNSEGEIWFGTNKGVVRFSEDELIKAKPPVDPVLHITGIKLFAEPFDLSSRSNSIDSDTGLPIDLVFRSDENHITVDFKGIRMKEPSAIRYQYYMEGLDQTWLTAENVTSITYSSLGFGDYCFKVRCVDQSGSIIGNEQALGFKILPPFYLRWWALLIEGILISGFAVGFAYWRRQIRIRNNNMIELTYRNRMQSLEQQSLNSSMNRHFIFNSLNAIQFYINREDKRAANRYLSSFAKLIRKNLDSTASTWVSLKDELERLELYLSLEHMRFKDKFSYHLEIGEEVDSESIRVPAMMLQPFVENSIWHGILPKQEPGQVDVSVARENGRLRIRIQDDGIGIDQSRSQKGEELPDHESKGMDITHHRLRLYSEMTGTDFEIIGPEQIEDGGRILGTRIDVFIPVVDD